MRMWFWRCALCRESSHLIPYPIADRYALFRVDAAEQDPAFILPNPFPSLKPRPKAATTKMETTPIPLAAPTPADVSMASSRAGSRKRSFPDDNDDAEGDDEVQPDLPPPAKRAKANDGSAVQVAKEEKETEWREDKDGYIVIEEDDEDEDIMEIL